MARGAGGEERESWTCSEESHREGGGGTSRAATKSGEVRSAVSPAVNSQDVAGRSSITHGGMGATGPGLQEALNSRQSFQGVWPCLAEPGRGGSRGGVLLAHL